MPVRLVAPTFSTFTLDKSDEKFGCEGEPTIVDFRQARQHEYQMRDQLLSRFSRELKADTSDNSIVLNQNWSMEELHAKEVFLTICGCNLINDTTHEPLLRFKRGSGGVPYLDMSEAEFMFAWGTIDPFITNEIIERCQEANLWDEKGKKS